MSDYKMTAAVDILPLVSDKMFYMIKGVDLAKKEDFNLDAESMRELMLALRKKIEAEGLSSSDVHIVGEFSDDCLTDDDRIIWETDN
ncbi:hypothetical protein [Domibacillus aminovorans]|uniref:Uncharacterized protein n=1 Tax=Domibacillus aminovorans TaxID=29332 RepID=A0A177L7M6_9BACI|nr:hypothetical protein [Domibacillus aminovorans]OAH61297.1 hypothetical protein AWH49_14015 [Domibacillus aminovorans]